MHSDDEHPSDRDPVAAVAEPGDALRGLVDASVTTAAPVARP